MSTATSPTVSRVLAGQLCTGCGLCASVAGDAIEMSDVTGYNRPVQRGGVTAEAENVIANACPGAVVAPWPASEDTHPYWGYSKAILTGHATDPDIRFRGSSGGAITALLAHALRSGLVDRVLHITADPIRPTRNVTTMSLTEAEIVAGAGSRYTGSSPLAAIDEALAAGGKFAFVGKPCDASALRQLAKVDPRVDRQVPIVISFFCGGMPNHRGVDAILAALGVNASDLSAFRYRGFGWPGRATAYLQGGREASMTYADSWGGYLSKDVQFRCKICPDAIGGVADIACADAWYGGESGYPQFEEQDGRSLILARTSAGERLLASAKAAGEVASEPLDIRQVDLMQPIQARRKRLVLARLGALAATLQPWPEMRGLSVIQASRRAGLKEMLHNFLGSLRRIITDRR